MTTGEAIPEWTLQDRLRKAREYAGMKQDDLAEKMGISKVSLSRYESAVRQPSDNVVTAWAEATGVSLRWLKEGYIPPTPVTEVSIKWTHSGIAITENPLD